MEVKNGKQYLPQSY